MSDLRRMWINQPSTLQSLRRLHGRRVLVCEADKNDITVRVYFLDGDVISSQIPKNVLSTGWDLS